MAFRSLTRGLFQLINHQRLYSTIQKQIFIRKPILINQTFRTFSAVQINDNAYKDLSQFLDKEIQLEKSAQKYPRDLPKLQGFEVQTKGPEVTLKRQLGSDQVTVKFNITNTVNASDSDQNPDFDVAGQQQQPGEEVSKTPGQLKSRPTFTVDINRGGQTLSFLCSYLPNDYSNVSHEEVEQQKKNNSEEILEDFQIDEFTIHDGEWTDNMYSADCAVIDGELYDKLLNLLEEHGIGEEFANQLVNFSTAYEHRQYIDLLEKLQKFSKK